MEGSANNVLPFFCVAKGSFRAPVLQYRLRFLPLSLIDFFEASPYGVLANGGGFRKALFARGRFLRFGRAVRRSPPFFSFPTEFFILRKKNRPKAEKN